MRFQYQAIAESGDLEGGIIDATSEHEAFRKLTDQGLTVVEIQEQAKRRQVKARRIKQAELLQLFEELVTLLRSGVSLANAVDSLVEGQVNDSLGLALEEMSSGLQQGKPFSEVLRSSSLQLPGYLLQLASAGELSGKLADALAEGVEQMRFDEKIRSETGNALIYPAVLVVSGILAVGLVFALVVPKFSNLLDEKADIPWLATMVLKSGMYFNDNLALIVAVTLAAAVGLFSLQKKAAFRQKLLDTVSRWPVVGVWLVETETGRWAAVLGALLGNGVALMDALALANDGVRISFRQRKLKLAAQAVKGGEALSEALKSQGALLPTAYNILRVGEKSGELPAMLKSLATLYENSSRNRMKRLLILIEPLAILLIGGAIGIIILGIVLAITSASDVPL